MLLIMQGLQTGVLAWLCTKGESTSCTGLDHKGLNHLTAPIQTPSSLPNLPLAPQPAQPTTTSTSTPPPLSHSHAPSFLSPAVCQSSLSLSLHFLKVARAPLFFAYPLHIPPPLFFSLQSVQPRHGPFIFTLHKLRGSQAAAVPKPPPETLFPFLTFFGPSPFPSGEAGRCVSGVCSAVCGRSPVSCSLPPRESRKVLSGEKTGEEGFFFLATMKAQLLLLVALVGPFCAFTHASPTEIPTGLNSGTTERVTEVIYITEPSKEELTAVTRPPATKPASVPEVTTVTPSDTFTSEEAVVATKIPANTITAAPEPLLTDAPVFETKGTTEDTEAVDKPEMTIPAKVDATEEVVIVSHTDELTSGHVVGIVIGAILAVIIVIAVVIAVVRRMGKYSP
ncbi:podoplanin [Embiotoca jacksoni]|uniref:podoplanin n=1 Tax=Embiotoca jacksoni TaxID=100190 RepID=UPI003704C1C3